jgi:hypothetical protein
MLGTLLRLKIIFKLLRSGQQFFVQVRTQSNELSRGAHFVCLRDAWIRTHRDAWIRTQRADEASLRAAKPDDFYLRLERGGGGQLPVGSTLLSRLQEHMLLYYSNYFPKLPIFLVIVRTSGKYSRRVKLKKIYIKHSFKLIRMFNKIFPT